MRAFALGALAALATVAAAPAAAQTFPTRGGESGLLDVPTAEVVGPGRGLLGAELRLDRLDDGTTDVGPFPLSTVGGLTERLELGLSLREWGQPGDPRPSRLLFGAALKLQLLRPQGVIPGLALSAVADRFNADAVAGLRLVASTPRLGPVLLTAYAGAETAPGTLGDLGLTWGAAASLATSTTTELVAEALSGPRGPSFGGAFRWQRWPELGVGAAFSYLPDEKGWRASLLFAFGSPPKKVERRVVAAPVEEAPPEEEAPAFALAEDRPRFRLKMPIRGAEPQGAPRHRQHAPYAPPTLLAPAPSLPVPRAAPGADEVLEAQLREDEAQAEAQLRRLKAAAEQLATRDGQLDVEARRLDARERELAAREQQLDAREKRASARRAPTQAQRQLEAREAQLGSAERQLAAQERSLGPALDAAAGRERDAADRQNAEALEIERLRAVLAQQKTRPQQVEVRRQVVAARRRHAAAMEARLEAAAERVDARERQQRTRVERLDTWSRRLDARAERIELLERKPEGAMEGVDLPRPATEAAPAAPKDKSVFVMVVKSPQTMVKESAAPEKAGEGRQVVHPGVAVEKAVAAAAVFSFPLPSSTLSELDRESLVGIARLAAREGAELLVWARAKDPSLMSEANRRALEVKQFAISSARLPEKQVVTRITVRPGASGVDVVVSALKAQGSRAVEAPGQGAPPPAPSAAAREQAVTGETGKRQVRDAVMAVQPDIERCLAPALERQGLEKVEGVLRLTVNPEGKVLQVSASGSGLTGDELEACLRGAATGWKFPANGTEYLVDVPITVLKGGAAK